MNRSILPYYPHILHFYLGIIFFFFFQNPDFGNDDPRVVWFAFTRTELLYFIQNPEHAVAERAAIMKKINKLMLKL